MSNFKSKLKTVIGLIVVYGLTRGIQVGSAIILDKYFKVKLPFGPENNPLTKLGVKRIPFEQVFIVLPFFLGKDNSDSHLEDLFEEKFDQDFKLDNDINYKNL
jgi:hypothetical protein